MNYKTFGNLQLRLLPKKSFHSICIDLRDTNGEKILFVPVGITRLVPIFGKASSNQF